MCPNACVSLHPVASEATPGGLTDIFQRPVEEKPGDSRLLTSRVVQTKHLFFIIKQAKHALITVCLSKHKYSEGVCLVLCLIIFGHMERANNIPFPQR